MKKETILLGSLVALATTVAASSPAHAEGYVDGPLAQNRVTCPISNANFPGASTWVSYYTVANRPATGDVMYMRAVVGNINPCAQNDIASHMFITLPETVQLAVNEAPVYCLAGTNPNALSDITSSACTQTPTLTNKGWDFGSRPLPPGWFFEIRFPVRYNKWNGSITWNRQLHVMTESTFSPPVWAHSEVPIDYKPKFENHRLITNSSGFDATVGFDLTHYYEAGEAYIVYSTDPNFNWPSGTQPMQSSRASTNPAWLNHPNSTATLPNLVPNTRYYWRIMMVSYLGGGVLGPVQSFVTPSIYVPYVPPCRHRAC